MPPTHGSLLSKQNANAAAVSRQCSIDATRAEAATSFGSQLQDPARALNAPGAILPARTVDSALQQLLEAALAQFSDRTAAALT